MNDRPISRRALLHHAGGITFLALTGSGQVAFAADDPRGASPGKPLPLFQVLPYLQPGPNGSVLRDGEESIVVCWQTNRVAADFALTFGEKGKPHGAPLLPERIEHFKVDGTDGKDFYRYAVTLRGMALETAYEYRITLNGGRLAEGFFTTRKKPGRKARFVVFGDNSFGDISDRHIAYQCYLQKPDFVVNTGDTVYDNGLINEFTRLFLPVHNADVAHPRVGAPILRSVLFYTVLGNHDTVKDNAKSVSCADFSAEPDAGGYYVCLHLPENGPAAPAFPMPLEGNEAQVALFRKNAGSRFPRTANYSFDYADAHFLCLDSNTYVDPTDPELQAWIDRDLAGSRAAWKIAVWHHPSFNMGRQHYANQHMRVLSPLLEKHGVSLVFSGHEHVYQRTRPLRFAPRDTARAKDITTGNRLVPGDFTVDRGYDGLKNTVANGIIYVVSGAGGKYLYDADQNEAPQNWTHAEDDHVEYGARFLSDRHSLTVIDMDSRRLTLRQIDEWGAEVDRFVLTKR
ncbi:MAG: metallophosphoesterase [Capsulimonadales bacterium]|nr:metallophosphoesterase [Capsulimonadales bacterium]